VGPGARDLYAQAHRELDRLLLPAVLEHARGSQHKAALLLGIARQTLRMKLRDLGLLPAKADAEEDNPL
jgi:two-component system nitrogen regulation response regulator GlnG